MSHPSPDDDRDLELRYIGPDAPAAAAALTELRRRHLRDLHARATRLCGGDPHRADDALQQLDLRLWEARARYQPAKGRWRTWAMTVLNNGIIDEIRKRGRLTEVTPAAADSESPTDPLDRLAADGPAPDWSSHHAELKAAMTDCLDRLPPEQRTVLILNTLEGLTLDQIAAEYDIPAKTVGTRVYRARHQMRDCLRRKGYEGGAV